jgi:hypothetical protein
MTRLLGLLLLAAQPLYAALSIAVGLQSLPVRGAPVAAIMALRAVVAGLSMAAGSELLNGREGGRALALWALGSAAVLDVFVLSTSVYPNNRAPGDTPFYIAATLVYHGAWMAYLTRRGR